MNNCNKNQKLGLISARIRVTINQRSIKVFFGQYFYDEHIMIMSLFTMKKVKRILFSVKILKLSLKCSELLLAFFL